MLGGFILGLETSRTLVLGTRVLTVTHLERFPVKSPLGLCLLYIKHILSVGFCTWAPCFFWETKTADALSCVVQEMDTMTVAFIKYTPRHRENFYIKLVAREPSWPRAVKKESYASSASQAPQPSTTIDLVWLPSGQPPQETWAGPVLPCVHCTDTRAAAITGQESQET